MYQQGLTPHHIRVQLEHMMLASSKSVMRSYCTADKILLVEVVEYWSVCVYCMRVDCTHICVCPQFCVDVDACHFVHHHCYLKVLIVLEHLSQQRRLSGAQKPRKQRNWDLLHLHVTRARKRSEGIQTQNDVFKNTIQNKHHLCIVHSFPVSLVSHRNFFRHYVFLYTPEFGIWKRALTNLFCEREQNKRKKIRK